MQHFHFYVTIYTRVFTSLSQHERNIVNHLIKTVMLLKIGI